MIAAQRRVVDEPQGATNEAISLLSLWTNVVRKKIAQKNRRKRRCVPELVVSEDGR